MPDAPDPDILRSAARRCRSFFYDEHAADLLEQCADYLTQSDDDPEQLRRSMLTEHPLCVVTGHVLSFSNAVLITAPNAAPAICHIDGLATTLHLLRSLGVTGVQVHHGPYTS